MSKISSCPQSSQCELVVNSRRFSWALSLSCSLAQLSNQMTLPGTSRNVKNSTSYAQNSTHTLQPGRVVSVSVYLKDRRHFFLFVLFFKKHLTVPYLLSHFHWTQPELYIEFTLGIKVTSVWHLSSTQVHKTLLSVQFSMEFKLRHVCK